MEDYNDIAQWVFENFVAEVQGRGITISGFDQETGALHIPNGQGETIVVRLDNLIDYYYQTRDENAVRDFVDKIQAMIQPKEDPTWEEARDSVYVSLYPTKSETQSPYAKEVTAYFNRFPVLDTPTQMEWILPELLNKWGITEEELEKQTLLNADKLLADTPIEIGDVEGHPLGSFRVQDRNLTAALLFAPGLKDKVSGDFGWPVYAVIPDKITCYFFGKDHYDYFAERIGGLVAENYEGSRHVTPELLEFNDEGVRSICSWTMQGGYIVKFDS